MEQPYNYHGNTYNNTSEIVYSMDLVEEASKYSRPQLYEAFNIEHNQRIEAHKRFLKEQLVSAELRSTLTAYERELAQLRAHNTKYDEDYLRLHLYKNIDIKVPEGLTFDENRLAREETISYFFDQETRYVFYTPQGGYICMYEVQYADGTPWYNFIDFMWADHRFLRKEMTSQLRLIKDLYHKTAIPMMYTGNHNVARNHCVQIAEDLWMLRLDDKFDAMIPKLKEIFNNITQPSEINNQQSEDGTT